MIKKVLVNNKAVDVEDTKVTFGAITATTPAWAKWVFRITFVLTSVFTAWIAATNLVSESWKFETILILKVIDGIAFAFSKMFGITLDKEK